MNSKRIMVATAVFTIEDDDSPVHQLYLPVIHQP